VVDKAPDAFRTISEVAEELDLPQHVLRFWETRFSQIKPMKRGGGRRYYRPDDVDLLRGIRHLLYGEGYTIRGVQRILKDHGIRFVQTVWQAGAPQPAKSAVDLEDAESGAEGRHGTIERGRGLLGLLPTLQASRRERPDVDPRTASDVLPADDDDEDVAAPAAPRPRQAMAPNAGSAKLRREEVAKLQATLSELVECRRLLGEILPDGK
jgi:DNA-binding transcriptional MerR regulator